jgi:hypothetical protein
MTVDIAAIEAAGVDDAEFAVFVLPRNVTGFNAPWLAGVSKTAPALRSAVTAASI